MKQKNQTGTGCSHLKTLSMQQMSTLTGGQEVISEPVVEAPASTEYSSISNVLKTKHDTAKNSVGNIR